jgi:hypothetical protein
MTDLSSNPDNLSPFLERVAANQKANIAKFSAPYQLLRRVDNCLSTAGNTLINPKPVLAGLMLLRCQYAYKAAAGMALSGQVVEAFVMMRSCLEHAGYALAIFQDPTLETLFMARHASVEGMSAQKSKFRIGKIRSIIASFDTRLAEVFQTFYERSVDFGGHPNPHGIMSAIQMPESPVDQSFTALALSTDKQVLLHAMKSTAQVGLTALFIFQHIFKAKFELLGIREEMDKLRSEHL